MDGDEGRDREREREREQKRHPWGMCWGGRSTWVLEVGGGNAAAGWDGVRGSVLEDGLGHVTRTLGI